MIHAQEQRTISASGDDCQLGFLHRKAPHSAALSIAFARGSTETGQVWAIKPDLHQQVDAAHARHAVKHRSRGPFTPA